MPVRIFIIEDHAVMREMLSSFLNQDPGIDICGMADTGVAALDQLAEVEADLILADVSLPEMNGIDLVEELQKRYPNLRCLMISGHGEANYVQRALDVGASGYVLKGNPDEILEAIREVSTGGTYLSGGLRMPKSKGRSCGP